jgi:glycosyltransferase involved in cell wall biosynthesis
MKQSGKIRVLQTIRQGKIGGGESHVLDLVTFLDKERFEPIVLAFTDGPMMQSLERLGIEGHVIETEKPFDLRVWRRVKAFMKEKQIDVVHVHGTRANTNVLWAARSLNLPVLYTIHGWSFHDGLSGFTRKARIAVEKYITRKTQLNISVSEANRNSGIREFGSFRSVVIKYGINLGKFNPEGSYENLRAYYNIPEDHLLLGYIVRMTYQKDPVSMVKAFAAVARQLPKVTLLMIGDGELKGEVTQLIKELGIENRVVMDGFRQDVPAVLNAIDIYCLPSLWEGLPIGVLEAMAMGKTVVASDVDGTREAVEHFVSGCLVPPHQPETFADTLLKVAAEPELRRTMQQNAIATIRKVHDVESMTRRIEQVYEEYQNS